MAQSGCVSVGIGMESGSQRMLDFIKKGTKVEKMEENFWLFIKHGIMPRLYLIHGLPTETAEDFNMTQDLLKRLDYPPYTLGRFIPYPGTALIRYCNDHGLISQPEKLGQWGEFTNRMAFMVNLSQIPKEAIEASMASYVRGYALRPLRFAFKYNRAYFLSAIVNPLVFIRSLKNLAKYYIMMLLSSRRGAGSF